MMGNAAQRDDRRQITSVPCEAGRDFRTGHWSSARPEMMAYFGRFYSPLVAKCPPMGVPIKCSPINRDTSSSVLRAGGVAGNQHDVANGLAVDPGGVVLEEAVVAEGPAKRNSWES
jgi:hypothetical protein